MYIESVKIRLQRIRDSHSISPYYKVNKLDLVVNKMRMQIKFCNCSLQLKIENLLYNINLELSGVSVAVSIIA